jgi:hypothetical protein
LIYLDDSLPLKNNENEKINNKSSLNSFHDIDKQDKNNQSLNRAISSKSREKSAKSQNLEKNISNKTDVSNPSIKQPLNNKIINNPNNTVNPLPNNTINTHYCNSNVVSNNKNSASPVKQKKEEKENENDISCQSLESIKTPNNKEKVEIIPKELVNDIPEETESQKNSLNLQPITYRYTNPKSKKGNKEEEFPEIRVVKSYEDKELRQNFEQFDIEYMCRCLGLALMKHIESAKDKQHILDLINIHEKFDFFNSVFNLNFDFFNSFLNLQNKISNLDKLDEYFRINENNIGINSKEMQFMKENNTKKNEPLVSLYSHLNYGNEIPNETNTRDAEVKKSSNTFNTKAESIQIAHGNNNLNSERYKNVSDRAKTILTQDLTAINEVDSMEFVKNNLLFTVDQKIKKQPSQFIDLLQESATNFLAEKDEKHFQVFIILKQKNSETIKEQNEEEYDEFHEEVENENQINQEDLDKENTNIKDDCEQKQEEGKRNS